MPSDPADRLTVGPAGNSDLPEVLRLLFAHLDPIACANHTQTLLAGVDEGSSGNQIILVARRGARITAAVWIQMRPGRVASLHPPAASNNSIDVVELIHSAVLQAYVAGAQFVQTLLVTDAGPEVQWLNQCGFKHAADLLYLVSSRKAFPPVALPSKVQFQSLDDSAAAMGRLETIIERTCQGSQDCSAIHGVQTASDAVASYQATGHFDPSRWFIVRKDETDVGCLLLTDHSIAIPTPIPHSPLPFDQDWELIYMGLGPEARGQGLGIEIVRQAQWLAAQSRAERLVLAVDAANQPAIRLYSAAGFQTWDRRSVFLRTK